MKYNNIIMEEVNEKLNILENMIGIPYRKKDMLGKYGRLYYDGILDLGVSITYGADHFIVFILYEGKCVIPFEDGNHKIINDENLHGEFFTNINDVIEYSKKWILPFGNNIKYSK